MYMHTGLINTQVHSEERQIFQEVDSWFIRKRPGGSVVKSLPAKVVDAGDLGLILGSGRSPGKGNATHSSIFAWRIPWTEEPGRSQSMVSQRIRHD